jgi:glycosyltransferase involved in cell wall biosynthesis
MKASSHAEPKGVCYYSVGAFPPPWCGVSFVNQRLSEITSQVGVFAAVFNTSAMALDERTITRMRRIPAVFRVFARFIQRQAQKSPVYLSASGGYAILYETAFALIARRSGAPVAIHHNSFRYINERFWPMKLLRWAAGRAAVHIMLSESMARRFAAAYGDVKYLCVSNCAFLQPPLMTIAKPTRGPCVVGFLSNLSEEKGLEDVMALAELARSQGLPWRFRIGGPFASMRCEARYRSRLEKLENVELLGSLLGDAKCDFYASLDVFVMPTRYFNEAEPIVVLEAMQYGVPVIAYERGVLPEVLQLCGIVVPNDQPFAPTALHHVARWASDHNEHERARRATLMAYQTLFESSRKELDKLVGFLRSHQKVVCAPYCEEER